MDKKNTIDKNNLLEYLDESIISLYITPSN